PRTAAAEAPRRGARPARDRDRRGRDLDRDIRLRRRGVHADRRAPLPAPGPAAALAGLLVVAAEDLGALLLVLLVCQQPLRAQVVEALEELRLLHRVPEGRALPGDADAEAARRGLQRVGPEDRAPL